MFNKKDLLKLISSILGVIILFGIVLSFIIWFFQDKILFYPSHDENGYQYLLKDDSFEQIKIEKDDYILHGWLKRNSDFDVSPLVIYFGGNAQNSSRSFSNYNDDNFFKYFGNYNVLYVDYPGYGLSTGKPTGSSILQAGLDIYDYATELEYVDKNNIVILGFSIGTGVANYVASLRSINGLILLAPYDDLINMYNDNLNIFYGPLKLLVKHKIISYKYATKVKVPPIIIFTKDDEVINYKHSINLTKYFNNVENTIILNGFGHNDFFAQQIVLENIYNYLNKRT